jgi:hypothetical protein
MNRTPETGVFGFGISHVYEILAHEFNLGRVPSDGQVIFS